MTYSQSVTHTNSHSDNSSAPRYPVSSSEPSGLSLDCTRPTDLDDCTSVGFKRSDIAAAVAEFHAAFDLPCQAQPSIDIDRSLEALRISLLEEEVGELVAATRARDLVGIADALADITYVVYGTALTYGIDLDAVLGEVHRSNMSKLDHDGKPIIRADGKVLKSGRYSPPDVTTVLQRQNQITLREA